MAAINLGPNGLPVQLAPAVPQNPPAALPQTPAPQPPTAIPPVESQASGNTRNDVARLDGNGGGTNHPPPSGGRGRVLDIKI